MKIFEELEIFQGLQDLLMYNIPNHHFPEQWNVTLQRNRDESEMKSIIKCLRINVVNITTVA